MAKKKSNTAALVEHNVADEEHPERLPLEETWPAESAAAPEDDGTEPFGHSEDGCAYTPDDAEVAREIGLSSEGPFIAPAPAPEAPASTTTSKRAKLTVASMTREQAFSTFRDKLFELCFKYGFTIVSRGDSIPQVEAIDIGDAKGTAKRALAVGNHISGLGLLK